MWKILLAIVVGLIVGIMDGPVWVAYVILAVIAVIELQNMLYAAYFSKNLTKLTKYVEKNKKNPVYKYTDLMREGTDEQLIEAINLILKKYKQPKIQAIYGANAAILQKDFEAARCKVKPVANTELGQYTMALIEAMTGKREEAMKFHLKKDWMNASIEANLAYTEQDYETFNRQADRAIDEAAGMQYYSNYYVFKRMKDKINEA